MTNRTITRARLSDGENTVLQAIRRWQSTAVDLADVKADGPEAIALAAGVRRFMDFLQDADPYVVQVRRTGDEAVTLFELQLLYAIAEYREGNADTSAELLDWWFPAGLVDAARSRLAALASVIETLPLTFNPSEWVRDRLLAVTESRVRTRPALAPGSAATSFGFWTHRTQTFH